VTEPEALEHPGTELLEEDVVPLDHPQNGRPRARLLQVEADAALAAVQREERGRRVTRRERRRQAQVVARTGVLQLVDAGAEVGQGQRGERARQQPREIEDADAGGAGRPSRRAHWKLKSFWSFIASIGLPVTLSLPEKKSCIPLAWGFSTSFWKSSSVMVMVQSLPRCRPCRRGPWRSRRCSTHRRCRR